MRKQIFVLVVLVAGGTLFQGCSHADIDRRIDEKLSREGEVKGRSGLRFESAELIRKTPNLSADQRSNLFALQNSIRMQLDRVQEDSLKLRALLIREVVSTNYDPDEVDVIKRRLKELEEKRLAVMFMAVDQATGILGRAAPDNAALVNDMFDFRGPHIVK